METLYKLNQLNFICPICKGRKLGVVKIVKCEELTQIFGVQLKPNLEFGLRDEYESLEQLEDTYEDDKDRFICMQCNFVVGKTKEEGYEFLVREKMIEGYEE